MVSFTFSVKPQNENIVSVHERRTTARLLRCLNSGPARACHRDSESVLQGLDGRCTFLSESRRRNSTACGGLLDERGTIRSELRAESKVGVLRTVREISGGLRMSRTGSKLGRRIGVGLGSWLAGTLLALGLMGLTSPSAAELTSIDVSDAEGPALDAKVAVADAETGLPVASGRTDTTTGRFSFSSLPDSEFIVTVNTASGYLGAARVGSGATTSIDAETPVTDLSKALYSGSSVTLNRGTAS